MPQAARKPAARSAGVTITTLYTEFEKAHTAYRAIPDAEEKRWERALAKVCRLAAKIVRTPALDITEMLLKIRVAAWEIGDTRYEQLEELDSWKPTRYSREGEYHALASLRDDLQAMRAV